MKTDVIVNWYIEGYNMHRAHHRYSEPSREKGFKSNYPYVKPFRGLVGCLYLKHLLEVMIPHFG